MSEIVQNILCRRPEYPTSLVDEAREHFRASLRGMQPNVTLATVVGGVGAGHDTQRHMLQATLLNFLPPEGVHVVTIQAARQKGLGGAGARVYEKLQRRPRLNSMSHHFVCAANHLPSVQELVNNGVRGAARSDLFAESYKTFPYRDRPHFIMTTHSIAAQSAVRFAQEQARNQSSGNIYVIEYVPDPFPPFYLNAMTAADTTPDPSHHVTILHDPDVMRDFIKLTGGTRNALALGTLSNPYASGMLPSLPITHEERDRKQGSLHIAALCSGSQKPHFDARLIAFMRVNREMIRAGEIDFTVVTMQHKGTFERIASEAYRLGLLPEDLEEAHIHFVRGADMKEAIEQRELFKEGYYYPGQPDAVMVSGGELTVEDLGKKLGKKIAVLPIVGTGHELHNIEQSAAKGYVIRAGEYTNPNDYLRLIQEKLREEELVSKLNGGTRSIANFALAFFMDHDLRSRLPDSHKYFCC